MHKIMTVWADSPQEPRSAGPASPRSKSPSPKNTRGTSCYSLKSYPFCSTRASQSSQTSASHKPRPPLPPLAFLESLSHPVSFEIPSMLCPSYPPQSPSQIWKLGVGFESSAGWQVVVGSGIPAGHHAPGPIQAAACNTRFIKRHKPSNHIRARIKSHVYTTE